MIVTKKRRRRMKETSVMMMRKRKSSGKLNAAYITGRADEQNHLYSCWSGKSLATS
jgi:hypothetical protein